MTQDSMLPPPKKGKPLFLILGVAAALVIGAVVLMSSDDEGAESAPEEATNVIPERQVGFRQEAIVLEDEPDAAVDAEVADAEVEETETARRGKRGPGASGGCNGTLNAAAARSVVNRQRGAVRSCYERRLKAVNNLQGQVMVNVRIGTGGQVSGVNVSGSLRDPEVFGCIRNTVSRWQFPSPEGGCANLRVPFSFTPRL